MSERRYFVLCEDNCRFEAMTKEQIYAAIAEATGHTPTPVDEAFITKIKDQNTGKDVKFWVGTNAEYNAVETKDEDTIYIITDESGLADLVTALAAEEATRQEADENERTERQLAINTAIANRVKRTSLYSTDVHIGYNGTTFQNIYTASASLDGAEVEIHWYKTKTSGGSHVRAGGTYITRIKLVTNTKCEIPFRDNTNTGNYFMVGLGTDNKILQGTMLNECDGVTVTNIYKITT